MLYSGIFHFYDDHGLNAKKKPGRVRGTQNPHRKPAFAGLELTWVAFVTDSWVIAPGLIFNLLGHTGRS